MKKTDEDLIARLKQAQKDKAEVDRRYQMNREYQEKLKEIKKEEQRHLRAAKKVPPTFEHKYEMDQRTEEQLKQTQEAFALDDLRSLESSRSPERGGIGTQTDFKVVSEMAAEEEEE